MMSVDLALNWARLIRTFEVSRQPIAVLLDLYVLHNCLIANLRLLAQLDRETDSAIAAMLSAASTLSARPSTATSIR